MEINPWEEQKAPVPPGPSGSCRRGSHHFMSDGLELPSVGSETVPALLCDTSEASVVLVTAAWFRGLRYDSLRKAEGNKRGRRETRIVFPGEVVRGKSLAAQGAAGPPHHRQPGQNLPGARLTSPGPSGRMLGDQVGRAGILMLRLSQGR